jgi:hypothetical protein
MSCCKMRQNGVRSLQVYCLACHRETALDVEVYPDDVPVASFGARMVRTSCGMVGADARPNWDERRERSAFGKGPAACRPPCQSCAEIISSVALPV